MLVILRSRTRKRITVGVKVLVTMFVVALVISHMYNIYQGRDIVREGWLKDDRPSGNPMRVENTRPIEKETTPGALDQFQAILRDFYQKDQ